jgi:hypothetical protein
MSFVGMLYTFPSSALTANGVSVHLWHDMLDSWVNYINISAWGFGVARFDKQGNILGASNREASDRASRFFYVPLTCSNEKHS